MNRRILIPVVALALLATPAFAQFDLGLTATVPLAATADPSAQVEALPGFHFGYGFLWLFYGSLDSIVLGPQTVQSMTKRVQELEGGGIYETAGYYRPGFLNLADVGARLIIGPFVAAAQFGLNSLYIYKQQEILAENPNFQSGFGANFQVTGGLRFGFWGVSVIGTAVFPDMTSAIRSVSRLVANSEAERTLAFNQIVQRMIPTLAVVLYL
jgi:hypothetical protein